MEVWIGLVSVVVGAAAGAFATLVTTRNRMALEQQLTYDRGLRDLRLPHYQGLYHASRCIPREWRPGDEPSRCDLVGVREGFHDWLGEGAGGMFLSEARPHHLLRAAERAASDRPTGSRCDGSDVADRIGAAPGSGERSAASAPTGPRDGRGAPAQVDADRPDARAPSSDPVSRAATVR